MIRPLVAVFRAQFRNLLQYRGAAVGGLVTQVFFGLVFMMVYQAVYAGSKGPRELSLAQTITYVWLNQAFFAMQPWAPDGEVRQMMRTGTVAYELTRPCPLYGLWFARAVALRTAPSLLRAIPLALIAYLFFGLQLPAGLAPAGWWAASMLAAVTLSSAITVVLNCTLFWTISGEGVTMLMPALVMVLSGQNLPLPLFPRAWQTFLILQPFRGLLDVPARIYSGAIPPAGAALNVAGQCAWCVVFVVLGRMLAARGLRRLVVQGG
jgi:ABC-2 type transport system permease protein